MLPRRARLAAARQARDLMAEFERRLREHVDDRIRRTGRERRRTSRSSTTGQADARRHPRDGRVGGHRQHHARRREPVPRRAAAPEPRHRPSARPARSRDRSQSARARRRSSARSRNALQTLKAETRDQVPDPEGAEPGVAVGDQRIYADLNKHLQNLHVMPAGASRPLPIRRAGGRRAERGGRRRRAKRAGRQARRPRAGAEVDVMAMFRRMFGGERGEPAHGRRWRARRCRPAWPMRRACRSRMPAVGMPCGAIRHGRRFGDGGHPSSVAADGSRPRRRQRARSRRWRRRRRATCPARRSSRRRPARGPDAAAGRADRISTSAARTVVQFSGIPQGMHNVLRDLQESPLGTEGEPARVDDHRDGRDAVRLHLRDQGPARRHQGAARAPADPGAQGRDARRRVLREEDASVAPARQRARAGRARLVAGDGARTIRSTARSTRSSTGSSTTSPTTSRSSTSCARRSRRSSPRRRRRPKRTSRRPPRRSTRRDRQRDRRGRRARPRSSGASRRIRSRTSSPSFLRQQWQGALEHVYLDAGRGKRGVGAAQSPRSRTSCGACSRSASTEDRKHLVALLPSLLKRLSAGMQSADVAAGRARARSCRTSSRRTRPR